MNRLVIVCSLLLVSLPVVAQRPVKVVQSGGLTVDTYSPPRGPSSSKKSSGKGGKNRGINIYGDIRGYSIEELAEQIRANADAQAGEIRAKIEEMEREQKRREEEARIKAVGDEYVRSTNSYYNQKKDEAYWQATVGVDILREQTSVEHYFTPGTHIIEKDDSAMDMQPVTTATDKSSLAAKLKQKRTKDDRPTLSSDMVFVPLNARANDYLKDVVQNNYQPAYYQYDNFVRMDLPSRGPSLTERMYNALDRTQEWAENRRRDGANALLNTSVTFCASVAKSSISSINAMAGQVMNAYDIVSNIGDVVNLEKGIINGSLDLIKNHWDEKDYMDRADQFFSKTEGKAKHVSYNHISDNLNVSPSKTIKNAASSWFLGVAKD